MTDHEFGHTDRPSEPAEGIPDWESLSDTSGHDAVLPDVAADGVEDLPDSLPERAGPSLEVGDTRYFDPDYGEWSDDPYSHMGDPERPELHYVPAGNLAVGRDGDTESDVGPVLEGNSEGCRIITLWNKDTREGALAHIGAEDMFTNLGEELLDAALESIPSLREPGVSAHVFGDAESSDVPEDASAWNERLAAHLRQRGLDPAVFSEGQGKNVYLDTVQGNVEVYNSNGESVYSYTPPVETGAEPPPAEGTPVEAEPPITYETSTRQLAASLAPHSRALHDAEKRAAAISEAYHVAVNAPDAPTDTLGKAQLLSDLLGDGRQAVDTLATIIQQGRDVLADLRTPEMGEAGIRELMADKISTAIGSLDHRIEALGNDNRQEVQIMRETLTRRRDELENIIRQTAE